MLFEVQGLTQDTSSILAALQAHDPAARVECDLAAARLEVAGQLTSEQVVSALRSLGLAASRASEPRQIHVSGGSDCCGSCS